MFTDVPPTPRKSPSGVIDAIPKQSRNLAVTAGFQVAVGRPEGLRVRRNEALLTERSEGKGRVASALARKTSRVS